MMTAKKLRRAFHPLTEMALRGCLIAKDEATNLIDWIDNSSSMALFAIKECERELDQIERTIDEELPHAITRVEETSARELLASLKLITDLERIGDLLLWVAKHYRHEHRIPKAATERLRQMAAILARMLVQVHEGFLNRDLALAEVVLATDKDINRICRSLFQEYFSGSGKQPKENSLDIVLMAQALERAGDHATNLAEELHHLIEGHTLRHAPTRKRITSQQR